MKSQKQSISQFELSPLAKAGVFVINMQKSGQKEHHDTITPHRDAHYLFMFATDGRFKLNLDFEELSVEAPAMLFVFPGQVHNVVEVNEPQGWAVSFDPSLIDNGFQLVLEQGFKGPVLLDKQTPFFHQMIILLNLIEKIQTSPADNYTGQTTHSLLAALLSLIAGRIEAVSKDQKTKESRSDIIAREFNRLLKQNYKSWKQPSQYAAEIAVSVSHLNDTVKEITGTSVSMHIQQHSIMEAKRLLYFTDKSVKEIGYALGYDEPVYFNKLFKKVTRLTPQQFRLKFRD
ncbi:AraC family transcriptional regulator [Dyadobacter subterraneus]|uniref:Helix-turn-helix domain-containing protein n=1 Tax=Dyadobacter subterraneus TaxID=2773304 RepID=A0ABR9WEW7_9BACT|nr:helix-turn-helix transcriptional regulator [Dyadobacter subterraneus]MBE9463471.1 helix-turn-helix domain-containing protein [Dyadobacter subterraneus]